jgi:hypothetical protein
MLKTKNNTKLFAWCTLYLSIKTTKIEKINNSYIFEFHSENDKHLFLEKVFHEIDKDSEVYSSKNQFDKKIDVFTRARYSDYVGEDKWTYPNITTISIPFVDRIFIKNRLEELVKSK